MDNKFSVDVGFEIKKIIVRKVGYILEVEYPTGEVKHIPFEVEFP